MIHIGAGKLGVSVVLILTPGWIEFAKVRLIKNYKLHIMKLSNSFSGALRTFAYFMASGSQYTLKGIDYLSLYGEEPSAIEQVFAIYANVIEMDNNGNVLNAKYAEKRATDYLRAYCDPSFTVEPPFEDWEVTLHAPPSLHDQS